MVSKVSLRYNSLLASVLVALAGGTQYLYSGYAPQIASRLGFSATQSSIAGLCCTFGSGILGYFAGIITDSHSSPKIPILIGGVTLTAGYTLLYFLWILNLPIFLLFGISMILIGFGSVCSYYCVLKVTSLNFPNNKGTANSIPVAAYGLSGLIVSSISVTYFNNNTKDFLLFLAISCAIINLIGIIYVNNVQQLNKINDLETTFGSLTSHIQGNDVNYDMPDSDLFQKKSSSMFSLHSLRRLSMNMGIIKKNSLIEQKPLISSSTTDNYVATGQLFETTITELPPTFNDIDNEEEYPRYGISLLMDSKFLTHFLIVAILAGITQMYIYSVGYIVKALVIYEFYDSTLITIGDLKTKIQYYQALQVSLISLSSFFARFLSGFISDFLNKLKCQRLWLILFSALMGFLVHFQLSLNSTTLTSNINNLAISSCLLGFHYGICFSVYPTVIFEKFGATHFTKNWGLSVGGPIITTFIFSKVFGFNYDKNSSFDNDLNEMVCKQGNKCYNNVFNLFGGTSGLALFSVFFVSFIIYRNRNEETKVRKITTEEIIAEDM